MTNLPNQTPIVAITGVAMKAAGGALKKVKIATLRRRAVRHAWKQEQALVQATGKGTRRWSKAEKAELLANGKVKGYHGHHINNVANHPNLAANPNNIEFVTPTEHLARHGGNWRNPTSGSLMDRTF